ncbi:MAG TPA: T9SS type A sorting domain-containing protein, partial [Bacteroidia bacterium]|nr:T9SS type A sorting domain-containing protein [Bacteroidia bacterium]
SAAAVSISGNMAQNIGGTNSATFNNLILNNTSGGITLAAPENIRGILTLTGGILKTTTTNILTLNAGATATSGNSNSYIDGPMAKKGNTAFVFPLGNGSTWARLGVTAPATITNTLTAQYFHNAYTNTTSLNAPLANVSTIEYWTLSESVAGDAVNTTLYWQNALASGIQTYDTTLRIAHFNGSSWDDKGQVAITAGSAGNITSVSVSSFSPFTFGSTNLVSNPLPIELLSFQAQLNSQGKVDLTWSTASELNNKEFTVERTLDGSNYSAIALVPAAGNSTQTLYYATIDESPYTGISYYRLKQTDFDGNAKYSNIETINIISHPSFTIYPNPAHSSLFLNYYSQINTAIELEIIDMAGHIIENETACLQQGNNSYLINIDGLANGIYFLKCNTANEPTYLKFIKQ